MLSSPFRSSKPFYMHPVFFYNCIIITPASATKFCYSTKGTFVKVINIAIYKEAERVSIIHFRK